MTDDKKSASAKATADKEEVKEEKPEEKKEEEKKPASPSQGGEEQPKEEPKKPAQPDQGGEEPKEEPKAEEKPKEEPKEEPKKEEKPASANLLAGKAGATADKKPVPTGKYKELIKQIEGLSVVELAELVKELEERFGVSAAAPVAAAPAAGAAAGAEGAAEEKTLFTVELTDSGSNKIAVIKAVREVLPDLGLKEAKDLVEAVPKTLKENIKKEEAEEYKKKMEEAGAKVELK